MKTDLRLVDGIPGLSRSTASPRLLLGHVWGIERRSNLIRLPDPRRRWPLAAVAIAWVVGAAVVWWGIG